MASIRSTLLALLFSVIMVIRMGEVVEGCNGSEPPECNNAFCYCAGGGFVGSAMPLVERTCMPFPDPCSNSEELCNQCFSEAGCSGSNKRRKGYRATCKKSGRSFKCTKGGNKKLYSKKG